ncbi:MAG: ThiF family adenylyltransferase [Victivallaceae bacterium]|nr:ThiF family adenylyltransferase [Victivallaceae bacterium]
MPANLYLSEAERGALENAVVGIAGAGGLGSNCAAHLVRAGVRRLVIADFDTVTESNLNRQFFFRDQIGYKKIDALRENLLRIEPGLELELHDSELNAGNIAAIFEK